jgi:hypothetical protein
VFANVTPRYIGFWITTALRQPDKEIFRGLFG